MFNTKRVKQESLDALSGIVWFIFLTPVAIMMYYLAEYYSIIWYTIMGWFVTTIAAIQLGIGIARGGRRLFRLPLKIESPSRS